MVLFQRTAWTRNLRRPGLVSAEFTALGDVPALALPRFSSLGQNPGRLGLSFVKCFLCPLLPTSVSSGGWASLCFAELLEKTNSIKKIPGMVTFHFDLLQPLILYDSNLMTHQGHFPLLHFL